MLHSHSNAVSKIRAYVQQKFLNENTGHDWYHISRVTNLAKHIGKKEGGNPLVIELAALLHDISDYKFNGGDFEKGGDIAFQLLEDHQFPKDICSYVSGIVKNVSFKGSAQPDTMQSLEGKIVQDADRLDAIGAIGIARTFAYGGAIGQPIYNPDVKPMLNQTKAEYISTRSHTINHFYEKLLLLKDRMHTETARELAKERTQFMKKFLAQFYAEWENLDR